MNVIKYILIGAILGVSNVIPGVSGGTMAIILNVYDRLIDAMTLNMNHIKNNFFFLLYIGIGAVVGIFTFSGIIKNLLFHAPMPTGFFFMGIIIGGIPMIYNRAKDEKLKLKNMIPFFIALGVMLAIQMMKPNDSESILITMLTIPTAIRLFLSAAIASIAMIVPGISGSFIMLVLGVYTSIITAISSFNIPILIVVGLGVLVGIVFGAKLIKNLIQKHPQAMYCAILGLIFGSLFEIYPGFSFTILGVISIAAFIVGFMISYLFSIKNKA
ncbi:MAG: DUF368 domain-containing protein [Oscillospiraceae bacterium]